MESVYLKTLREVIRCGSFSKAADVLFVTQSAVSRRVKFLEEQLDTPLLDRSGKVLVPTETGNLVMQKAEQILAIEQDLLSDLKTLKCRRQVSFCCTPPFALTYLSKVMKQYMLANAELVDLRFMMDTPDRIVTGLKEGVYDFAVMEHCECLDLGDFFTYDLPGDSMVFVDKPSEETIIEPYDLDKLFEKTLFTRIEGCCSRIFLENNLNKVGKSISDFRNLVVFEDINLILQSVKNGDGISYLSTDIIAASTSPDEVTSFSIEGFESQRKRTMVFNEDPSQSSLYNDFKEYFLVATNSQ